MELTVKKNSCSTKIRLDINKIFIKIQKIVCLKMKQIKLFMQAQKY